MALSNQGSQSQGVDWHNFNIQLSEPTIDDILYDQKKNLLYGRGLSLNYSLATICQVESNLFNHMLQTARILQLSETEWYFLEDDEEGPFSLRNELEALGMLHSTISNLIFSITNRKDYPSLQALQSSISERLNMFASIKPEQRRIMKNCKEVEKLMTWATEHGIQSKLEIIELEGFGRGGVAVMDINVGDLVLEVPMQLLISECTTINSDMGAVLSKLEGLSGESMALLWTMKERHAQGSKFAPYFGSLPLSFNTGLTFTMEGLKELDGTLVLEELLQVKEHLRCQYDSLVPALIKAYPETFLEQVYTWENFLWASELWYSNGVKVSFPDGTIKTCLIPVVGMLNHSVYPHITHYSRIHAATSTLRLRAILPCKSGEQCFLSYGALPNSELLKFYGFVLRDNPYDTIPVELDMPSPSSSPLSCELLCRYGIPSSHMLRATWLCKSSFTKNGLPSRLLAALRVLFSEELELQHYEGNPRYSTVSPANENAIFEALLAIIDPLIAPLIGTSKDSDSCRTENWDVKLASQFKDQQNTILKSLQVSCTTALHE